MSVEQREAAPRGQRRFYDRELAGVYRTTLDGQFVDCNLAMARLLGFTSREELLAAAAPLRFAGREASLGRLRGAGVVTGEEACLQRPDGRATRVVYSERLVREADGRELVEGTLIDVTARRGGTPGDRLLAALAGGVTHRMTEPLSSVVANLGFALETLSAAGPRGGLRDGATTLELGRALRDAKSGADTIRRVLRDLAVFARPAGAAPGADLSRLVEGALSVVAAELHGRARVEASLAESLPVPGSEALLGRCLLQVLLDALEAMGDGAADHVLHLSARREGRWAVLEVEDTGRRPEGWAEQGLGLLGCHVVVAALGGALSVGPGAGHGRRVRIELPAA